jgi:para-aminobenzoate synthetase component 1
MDRKLNPTRELPDSAAVAIQLEGSRGPLETLAHFTDLPHVCLLHSAALDHPLSRYSFLAADPVTVITERAEGWPSARQRVRATTRSGALSFPGLPPLQGGWIGWFSYELGTAFDRTVRHQYEPVTVPDVALGLYDWVIAWDHETAETWLVSSGVDSSGIRDRGRARRRADMALERWCAAPAGMRLSQACHPPAQLQSDFTADAYQRAIAAGIEHVLAGDIFQVNLAQRFSAPFAASPVSLYRELCERTAAPMAAFIQHDGIHVLSASPERFLRFDPRTRHVETSPIKGTRPRHADAAEDTRLARELQASDKDRAENVMIVDLQRNDLARVCLPGSVRVPTLNALESHPTVHHLVSTVTGELGPDRDALDLLAATFPGGSITGAPKLRAMAVIGELEPVARGVYSGAIGWIGLDGAMDINIAIRTVTIADGMATFHAGGAITAQSDPADEYRESLDKARALVAAMIAA